MLDRIVNEDVWTLSRLIRQRRTVKPKQMSDQPIEEAVLWQLLENANWAPTHGMTQPWRFTVFTGEARKELSELLPQIYSDVTPADDFQERKYISLGENPMLAPVLITLAMKRQESEKISELDEMFAVACAVQNMHLTAAAYGLGGFWSSNRAVCSTHMREFLGLAEKDRVLGLFYLGYPSEAWPDVSRSPVDDRVGWRGW